MRPVQFSPNLAPTRLVLLLLAPFIAMGVLYLALRAYPFDEDALKYGISGDGRLRYTQNLHTLGELIGFEIVEPPEAVIGLPLHYAHGLRAPDGAVSLYYGADREQFSISQSTMPTSPTGDATELDIAGTRVLTWPFAHRVNFAWQGCERTFHIAAVSDHADRARAVTEALVERCPGESGNSSVTS